MNRRESKPSPALRVVWPLEALSFVAEEPKQPKAVIISVMGLDEVEKRLIATGLAVKLAEKGVGLFALVGNESEQAHDALDWVLEEVGMDDVMTSWHVQDDPEDVASFVVAGSRASGLTGIVAVLDESTESGIILRNKLAEAVGVDSSG